jgi:hypothetical protein
VNVYDAVITAIFARRGKPVFLMVGLARQQIRLVVTGGRKRVTVRVGVVIAPHSGAVSASVRTGDNARQAW